MWPFSRTPAKGDLLGYKTVTIKGNRFVIKKLNPFTDFTEENMPQIFTTFIPRRNMDMEKMPEAVKKKYDDGIKAVLQAGVIEPALVPIGKGDARGKEDGVTADDLMRDPDIALRLYIEIVAHSLNRFKGVRGLFFSLRVKSILYTNWRKVMREHQLRFFSPKAATA